jgi:hypothetical protein
MNEKNTLQLVIDNLEATISVLEGELAFMKVQVSRLIKIRKEKWKHEG